MLLSAILVAIIATLSNWWVFRIFTRTWLYPIITGFLVGIAMGDVRTGIITGAYIQLAYLGWITAGGSMPGNLMVAGVYGTALTILSNATPAMGVTFAAALSLIGIIQNAGYMTLNSFWVHKADRYLEQGKFNQVRLMNYVPSGLLSVVLYGVPIFLMILFGADWAQSMIAMIPDSLANALNVVASLMPALGIGMLLTFIGKKKLIGFFFVGFFMSVYFGLDTMACFVFSACIAAILFFFGMSSDKEEIYDE